MRLIDYKCTVCGHIKHDHEGDNPPKCPKCRKYMWKIYPTTGITYNGDGYTGAQKGKAGRDGK